MKKLLSLLTLTALLLALAACGGGQTGAGSASGNGGSSSGAPDTSSASTGGSASEPAGASSSSASGTTDASSASTGSSASTSQSGSASEPSGEAAGGHVMVVYFSATGNTAGIAQSLIDGLGADSYEIIPAEPYTDADLDYGDPQSRSSIECNDPDARPAISGETPDLSGYDIILLGYPIWWGEAPRILDTFVESQDLSGKTVIPFCTSGSSGFGSSDAALKAEVPSSTWLEGHRFSAGASRDEVLEWVNGLGLNLA